MIKLDVELEAIEKTILKMGNKVLQMHNMIGDLCDNPHKELALQIIQEDEFVNHLEEEVNDMATSILALLSPVATDLRTILAALKIASELERIGDYAKNIAIFIIKHENLNVPCMQYCKRMEKQCTEMLKLAMNAYQQKDVEQAFEIPKMDKKIDDLLKELYDTLHDCTHVEEFKQALEAGYLLRNMERSGDHIKNICEHIIYLVKGQHYDFG